MVRISINGVQLDVPHDINLTFAKKNILFAFDDAECERTAQFELPATATNNAVFAHARDIHNTGAGMRVRYGALMDYNGVQRDGQLYVPEYDNEKRVYKCVFVTGELLGLLQLRQLGNLSEWLNAGTERVVLGDTPSSIANDGGKAWRNLNYAHDSGILHPSYSVGILVNRALTQLQIAHSAEVTDIGNNYLRGIVAKPRTPQNIIVNFATAVIDNTQPTSPAPDNYYNTAATTTAKHGSVTGDGWANFIAYVLGTTTYYRVCMFTALFDMNLTFPSSWSASDYVITKAGDGAASFLGGRSFTFDSAKTIAGEPLAGRTIQIARGTQFMFINYADWSQANGWMFAQQGFDRTYSGLVMSGNGTAGNGETVWLQDNLPDVTLVDLLKVSAAWNSKVLAYDETQGVYFSDLSFSGVEDISAGLIERGTMSRTFGEYAQSNVVQFDSADEVPEPQRIKVTYNVTNANIEPHRDLYVIPFSEGRASGANVYVPVTDEQDQDVICTAGFGSYLRRVSLIRCAGLQNILNKATTLAIEVLFPLWQFNAITAEKAVYIAQQSWIWIDGTWQNGIASIKIAKI